ncbi:hypothetical protein Tco_1316584 [Tanacetum coccineum]
MLGEYIARAPLTLLVKPGGGYLDGLQFGVGVSRGSKAMLHAVNRLIKGFGDDVGLSMLLVDFKNTLNLVDREEHTLWSCQGVEKGDPLGPLLFALELHPLICKIRDSFSLSLHVWYLDDGTIVGDTLVVGKVLKLILMRMAPGISRLYFTMCTCPPRVFESAQHSFALCSSLEHLVTTSRPGFGNWQWRVATLPFGFRGLGVYSAGDVLNFAFLMSQLWSAGLQTKPLRHGGIVASDPILMMSLIDVAQRKHIKYMVKCADNRYGFLPFSFSSLGEFEEDAVTLLMWIHKFSMV